MAWSKILVKVKRLCEISSCTLWALVINDLIRKLYLSILVIGKNEGTLVRLMQNALYIIENWCNNRILSLSMVCCGSSFCKHSFLQFATRIKMDLLFYETQEIA